MYASCFKLKHVAAPGQDPLARGWTRGGEIYLWQPKGVKAEGDVAWPPVATVRGELGQGTAPCPRAGGEGGGGAGDGGGGAGGGGSEQRRGRDYRLSPESLFYVPRSLRHWR